MIIEAYRSIEGLFHWVDVRDPTGSELEALAQKYNIEPESLQDCLTPRHLPKYEVTENNVFVILRAYDERNRNSGTVRGLTRKIAIFIGENYLLTIHRKDNPYIVQIRENWVKNEKNLAGDPKGLLLMRLVKGVFSTYHEPLYHCEMSIEDFENKIFNNKSTRLSIQQKFLVRRKISVIKRMIKMALDFLPKLKKYIESDPILFQDLQEYGESEYFTADEILDNVNNLINLNLSLASHQTSSVVRILTLVSVFFMPMAFIANIYGMNFKYMPELSYKYAYPIVLLVMFSISCSLFWWFKRKRWIEE